MKQYSVYLLNLDPTVGHEIKKTRPCVVISPDEMNKHLKTIIIAPMTTKSQDYPTRIKIKFAGKMGWLVVDQIRTVDRIRFVKKMGTISSSSIKELKKKVQEMLVD
ncbi:type II toxin-antitoxin system PemK/MazF family toxin [Promethearchaeum syntrophicum]|uniref:Type II toxin-antitoxin system PemK/MazF family toxin n=1 Tax=Promethearchaeum syntrophicum TaxID=2594042 RepID=A0A5B9DDY8_9ARCH|nr:type II toxin-antitoxin system PemK/MazF family toxin [Candidatus Prometheoarchaeum syntrophicum]